MNAKTALKRGFALFATTTMLSPAIALANHHTDVIIAQLAQAALYADFMGNYQLIDADMGIMTRNSTKSFTVTLQSGVDYKMIGVCDQDCSDVDLQLYNKQGHLIDSDIAVDDTPVVGVTPHSTGEFTVKVSMARCTTQYCYYGVGLFSH